jgi:hypothetical protein
MTSIPALGFEAPNKVTMGKDLQAQNQYLDLK